jgi:hypothetical protein
VLNALKKFLNFKRKSPYFNSIPLYGGSALKPILINLIDASSKQFVKIIYKNLLKTAVQTLTLSFSPLAVLN